MKNDRSKSDGTSGDKKFSKSKKVGWSNPKKHRRSRRNTPDNVRNRYRKASFKGANEELKGHIYDCSSYKQTEQFILTTKQIGLYVGRTYKNSQDIVRLIENLEEPTIPPIQDIDRTTATEFEKEVWQGRIKQYLRRLEQLEQNKATLYSLIMGQCTRAMEAHLQANEDWDEIQHNRDPIKLLKAIRSITFHYESRKDKAHALSDGYRRFYTQFQKKSPTLDEYLEQFKNSIEVIEHCGGILGADPALVKQMLEDSGLDPDTATSGEMTEATEEAQEYFKAVHFLLSTDRYKYGALHEHLQNAHSTNNKGILYPRTMQEAYNMLKMWRSDYYAQPRQSKKSDQRHKTPRDESDTSNMDEVVFAQKGDQKSKEVACFDCGAKGQYRNTCTNCNPKHKKGNKNKDSGELNMMMGVEADQCAASCE